MVDECVTCGTAAAARCVRCGRSVCTFHSEETVGSDGAVARVCLDDAAQVLAEESQRRLEADRARLAAAQAERERTFHEQRKTAARHDDRVALALAVGAISLAVAAYLVIQSIGGGRVVALAGSGALVGMAFPAYSLLGPSPGHPDHWGGVEGFDFLLAAMAGGAVGAVLGVIAG